ncbi:MAG: hypothetical protein HY744_12135 [Deltaproteobacteria bacterium]|nr:hypothetical protein [Deltaproteobacteria bacterium]
MSQKSCHAIAALCALALTGTALASCQTATARWGRGAGPTPMAGPGADAGTPRARARAAATPAGIELASYAVPSARATGRRAPPISLATADGAELELVRLSGRSVVQAPLGFTELRLAFEAAGRMTFPAPGGDGAVTIVYPLVFSQDVPQVTSPEVPAAPAPEPAPEPAPPLPSPLSGPLGRVMSALGNGHLKEAIELAHHWYAQSPGETLALVALGEAYEAAGERGQAARAYGSLVDMFPWRADVRRFAGSRLERVAIPAALELALDSFRKARSDRPDHPSSHRLLAFALLKQGRPAEAFEVLTEALARRSLDGRFPAAERVLREDLGLAAAAWIKAEPARGEEILGKLRQAGGVTEQEGSLRFVLTWETDANDVDLHVYDAGGGHAWFQQPALESGGELYADVTQGYGPECFTVRLARGAG